MSEQRNDYNSRPVPRAHALAIAMVCFILVAIIALWGTCAHAEERKPTPTPFKAAALTLAVLGTVDVFQSTPCLHAATCRELNPLYAHVPPAGFATIKAAGVGGVIWASWRARRTHPKTAWLILGTMTAIQGLVVAHNARIHRP
jgi:hypothetical protein